MTVEEYSRNRQDGGLLEGWIGQHGDNPPVIHRQEQQYRNVHVEEGPPRGMPQREVRGNQSRDNGQELHGLRSQIVADHAGSVCRLLHDRQLLIPSAIDVASRRTLRAFIWKGQQG